MINTPSYKRCYLKTKSGCLTVSRKINTEVSKKNSRTLCNHLHTTLNQPVNVNNINIQIYNKISKIPFQKRSFY